MISLLKRKQILVAIVIMALALASCNRCSRSLEGQLLEAACAGDMTKTRNLLMLGVKINATDNRGYSALMIVEACTTHTRPSRAELVELLIANGAAVNLQAHDGRTALMYASGNGDTGAVKALLGKGASVNTADTEGETALIKAARFSCNEQTIRALMDAGADLKAEDHKGQSALASPCIKSTFPELVQ